MNPESRPSRHHCQERLQLLTPLESHEVSWVKELNLPKLQLESWSLIDQSGRINEHSTGTGPDCCIDQASGSHQYLEQVARRRDGPHEEEAMTGKTVDPEIGGQVLLQEGKGNRGWRTDGRLANISIDDSDRKLASLSQQPCRSTDPRGLAAVRRPKHHGDARIAGKGLTSLNPAVWERRQKCGDGTIHSRRFLTG